MNSLIEALNLLGERVLNFAWPMLWQSSVLIAVLFAFDFEFRRRIRASVRYALWLVVLVKLLLPPSLALPTSLAWWMRPPATVVAPAKQEPTTTILVTYRDVTPAIVPIFSQPVITTSPRPSLSTAGWAVLNWIAVSVGLLAWLFVRWWQVARDVRRSTCASERLNDLLSEAQKAAGVTLGVKLRLTTRAMSPAVCGLIRPVILLPQSLVARLSPEQVRAVLLHELIHLRRGDVWVNCLQALLQIFYWWHPLFWLANARIRRVREEAVDDAVMLALADKAETYAPTLLEVAKLAFNRPLASLGLVGILESRSALRQRIERLVDFRPPRKAGLTIASALCVIALAALAVPMGEPPPSSAIDSRSEIPRGTAAGIGTRNLNTNSAEKEMLITRTLKFDAEVFLPNLRQRMHLPDKSTDTEAIQALPGYFAEAGLDLVPPCAFFLEERGLTLFKASQEKIEAIERLFTELNNGRSQSEIPNPGRPPDRETIIRKLDQIRFDSPAYKETPLIEVIRDLSWETKQHDPERKGFGFHIKYSARLGKPVDLSAVKVTASAFSNARLSDLLEAIVKGADRPIKYYIWAGVAFYSTEDEPALPLGMTLENVLPLAKATEPTDAIYRSFGRTAEKVPVLDGIPLVEKLFRSETNSFRAESLGVGEYRDPWGNPYVISKEAFQASNSPTQSTSGSGLAAGPAAPLPSSSSLEQLHVRRFKVDLNSFLKGLESTTTLPVVRTNASAIACDFFGRFGVELNPPKSIFFNDRAGELLVRATMRDFDTIESALQAVNTSAPQVNIKVRFVEIPVAEIRSLGFDWYPSNTVTQFTGILTEAQFRSVLRTLENRAGVDILTGPQVTTVSGRQAQIQTVDILTVVKGINPHALTPPGIASTNNVTNSVYLTETIPCGPVLDVMPTVEADGHTISMTVIPSVTEFLGYDKPGSANKVPIYINGRKEWVTATPLPKFRNRQITTSARVWDGQTLVLGGFTASDTVRVKDKVPVLGDVPGAGRMFRSESRAAEKKNLIVFVTPTLIDPAGNRVHADDAVPKPK